MKAALYMQYTEKPRDVLQASGVLSATAGVDA